MIWWRQRSVREKRLVATAAALLALVLVWFVLIRPLMDARANAENRLRTAATALAEARADALASTTSAGATGQAAPRPLAPFVSQTAMEQGFTNMTVTGDQPDRVSIVTVQVRPANFFGWIGQLEARGVEIESMTATANADQTIAVQAFLRAGGG